MAIKTPIIAIDVDDGAFSRFAALFARYQAQLKQMPGQWKTIGDEVDAVLDKAVAGAEGITDAAEATAGAAAAASVSFRQTFIAVGGAADEMGRVSGASRDAATSTQSQAKSWKDMARDARSFAGKIDSATRSLLRWTGLTGLISGILGAGGLFGIDRLASSAGNARKSSLGLGTTPGEQSAFGINYGRVLSDPNGFLSGVNDALHDVTKRHTLYGAGLGEADLAGKDTGQVSAELIPALKRIADQTPAALLGQVLQSRGLDQFITLQDFERLKATPAAEVAGYGRSYQKDAKDLDLNQQQLKAWQDLQVQLSRAGATIEKVFIVGLSKLADPIGHLSEAFVGLVQQVMKSDVIGGWIDKLASGIKWLGDNMGSQGFHDSVMSFLSGAEAMALKVAALLPSFDQIKAVIDGFNAITGGLSNIVSEVVKALKILWETIDVMARSIAKVAHAIIDPITTFVKGAWGKVRGLFGGSEEDNGSANDNTKQQPSLWDRAKRWWQGGLAAEPRGIRNNNPLNLQSVPGQEGAIGSDGRFGIYNTPESGVAAAARQLLLYQDRDHLNTISQIIKKWAPPNENDTAGYIAQVSKGSGFGENQALNLHDPATMSALVKEMIKHETGRYVQPDVVDSGVNRAVTTQIANNNTTNNGGGGRVTITVNNATSGNAIVSSSQLVS